MADKFRYGVSLGGGSTQFAVYENKLKLKVHKHPSPAIETKTLSGSVIFMGSEAESIWNYRTTNYFAILDIQEYSGGAWRTYYNCNMDIRGEYNRKQRSLTINRFVNNTGTHKTLESGLKNKFKSNELGVSFSEIENNESSTRLDVYSIPTALSQSGYRTSYNLEGQPFSVDDRWLHFLYYSTTGVTPNMVHRYSARSYTYDIGYPAYEQITFESSTYWVDLPPATYSDETLSVLQMSYGLVFDDVLDALVSGIDGSLSYDSTDDGNMPIDTTEAYIAYTNEFNSTEIEGIDITLKGFFDFIQDYYFVSWYIDSSKVKFQSNVYKTYNSTLDWSAETVNWEDINFSYNPMPDKELYAFQDKTLDRLSLSYFDKGVNTDDVLLDHTTFLFHDFFQLKKGAGGNNELIWVYAPSGTVDVRTPDEYWTDYNGTDEVFTEHGMWKIPTDPADVFTAVSSGSLDTRPIYSVKVDKWIDAYYTFDLFVRIYLDGNVGDNTGYLNSYEIDMNTGVATFDIWLDTLDI